MANLYKGIRPGDFMVYNPKETPRERAERLKALPTREFFACSTTVWSDEMMKDISRTTPLERKPWVKSEMKFQMDNSDMRIKYDWKKELRTVLLVLGLLVAAGFYAVST